MNNMPAEKKPPDGVGQVSPETEGAATIALVVEMVFGWFSVLGIGHVYGGRTALGIGLMIGWWVFIGFGSFIASITFGIAACLLVPLYIAVPIISGIQARTYLKTSGATGSWQSVALVAGGGCLLVIIAIVLIFVFIIGLGMLGFQ
jgi:hypothetical protein